MKRMKRMKRIKGVIILISALTWLGCGKVESEIQITEQQKNVIEGNNLQESQEEEIDTIEEVNTYMIPEQTFDIYLDDWGDVTFVSCKIPHSIFTDTSFFLIKEEQILYRFPHRFEGNRFEY